YCSACPETGRRRQSHVYLQATPPSDAPDHRRPSEASLSFSCALVRMFQSHLRPVSPDGNSKCGSEAPHLVRQIYFVSFCHLIFRTHCSRRNSVPLSLHVEPGILQWSDA